MPVQGTRGFIQTDQKAFVTICVGCDWCAPIPGFIAVPGDIYISIIDLHALAFIEADPAWARIMVGLQFDPALQGLAVQRQRHPGFGREKHLPQDC